MIRSVLGTLVSVSVLFCVVGGIVALQHPDTPLPPEWNPNVPLAVSHPVTPLTGWKLRSALSDRQQCLDVLDAASTMASLPDIENTENCYIRNRVQLSEIGSARIDPIETTCAIALRMVMWEQHGVQPAAQDILGSNVSVFRQVGSYNCRPIRTSTGASNRWSTHATAEAIDITGFDLTDGRRIRLIDDWGDGTERGAFLRVVQDSACKWFVTTLGPEYNALHADHFHLQSRGWGACR